MSLTSGALLTLDALPLPQPSNSRDKRLDLCVDIPLRGKPTHSEPTPPPPPLHSCSGPVQLSLVTQVQLPDTQHIRLPQSLLESSKLADPKAALPASPAPCQGDGNKGSCPPFLCPTSPLAPPCAPPLGSQTLHTGRYGKSAQWPLTLPRSEGHPAEDTMSVR